jgi:hypothetical protein
MHLLPFTSLNGLEIHTLAAIMIAETVFRQYNYGEVSVIKTSAGSKDGQPLIEISQPATRLEQCVRELRAELGQEFTVELEDGRIRITWKPHT